MSNLDTPPPEGEDAPTWRELHHWKGRAILAEHQLRKIHGQLTQWFIDRRSDDAPE